MTTTPVKAPEAARQETPEKARETGGAEWPGREHYRGYGVMALPFDSGHVLALRVMPENDFAPFEAVWHRTPGGDWSMFVDGPNHETFCPRFYGPILADADPASIDVSWTGERRLRVRMDEPRLDWTVTLRTSPLTRLANRVLPGLPLGLYRTRPALTLVRVLADRALGLGPLDLAGTLPAGQRVLVKPERLFLVGESRAVLDGVDLGSPVRARTNPTTGSFRWPALGVLAHGDVYVEIDDPEGHRRRLEAFRAS